MLKVSARALDAQRYGMDVAGQNIANVNTVGYTRRSVVLAEVPPTDVWSPGGGVDVVAVTAARAPVIDARLRFEQPAWAREDAIASHLAVVEAGLGAPGASLDTFLARFYNTYAALAQNPTSTTARQQVIIEGQTLASAFNDIASRFEKARSDADREIRDVTNEANALAQRIAELNDSIAAAGSLNVEGLIDQQNVALAQLGELVDINVIQHDDQSVDVTIGNGRPLVVAGTTYALSTSSLPPDGFAAILAPGTGTPVDITSEITGGRLGGLLQVRDVTIPNYIDQLDALAYGVATDVNTLTQSGYDLSGNPGLAFFDPPVGIAGAARLMSVNATVAASTNLVVTAATTAAGNNEIANAIAALQDTAMSGGTARPVDAWGSLVYRVAVDSRTATQAKTSHEQVVQQLKNLRDQISGVSIDEEAATLLRFQRSYEANARFFQVTNETLDLLMSLART